MQSSLQEELSSFLPPFANAANRQLDEDIKSLQHELQATKLQNADHEDRAVVMADHLSSVQREVRHSQTRLAAQKDEIAGEEHLQRLAAREEVHHLHAKNFMRCLWNSIHTLAEALYEGWACAPAALYGAYT